MGQIGVRVRLGEAGIAQGAPMNNMNWLIRASRWARNPPGPHQVKLVFGIIAFAARLFRWGDG